MSLWTRERFLAGTGGSPVGDLPEAVTGISIDSRTLGEGDAFFAIRGDRLDGHDFVADALGKGAALAVVEEAKLAGLPAGGRYVVVADVLEALRRLATAARARSKARILAVTGSVGKTSTKEALRLALSSAGETHASAASHNNHWGVPLSLARLPESAAFGVFEIGMNHAGEISPLARLVRPHVAIVTTIAPVHLEFFPSIEAIAEAKAEIFEGLEPGGIAILNADNAQTGILAGRARAAGARILTFGATGDGDARLVRAALKGDISCVEAAVLGHAITYKIGAPGRHLVINSLAVLTAVEALGLDLARAAMTLGDFSAQKGRGARYRLETGRGDILLIDESYNANPTSMRAAIAVLAQTPLGLHGRRIAVLGDMLELGEAGRALHRELAAPLLEAGIDRVHCAGPLMKELWNALPRERRGAYVGTSSELVPVLIEELAPGDAVMVKGSLGSRMAPIVEALKARFRTASLADESPA